ncbi:MAG: cytidine deaminase [Parcubacteria group bacterium Gr01-1014_38]|nr:MAG: cytidine deaminase [Parcubacteria group bacterium Gr01-1014_38]
MHVEVVNETTWRVPQSRIQNVTHHAEQLFGLPRDASVQLVFVADRVMRRLNQRAFRRNRPTDVLAFPLHQLRPSRSIALRKMAKDPDGFLRLGDVVISVPTAARHARRLRRPLTDEVAELFAHGVLHLLGYDHGRPREASRMEKLTTRLVA